MGIAVAVLWVLDALEARDDEEEARAEEELELVRLLEELVLVDIDDVELREELTELLDEVGLALLELDDDKPVELDMADEDAAALLEEDDLATLELVEELDNEALESDKGGDVLESAEEEDVLEIVDVADVLEDVNEEDVLESIGEEVLLESADNVDVLESTGIASALVLLEAVSGSVVSGISGLNGLLSAALEDLEELEEVVTVLLINVLAILDSVLVVFLEDVPGLLEENVNVLFEEEGLELCLEVVDCLRRVVLGLVTSVVLAVFGSAVVVFFGEDVLLRGMFVDFLIKEVVIFFNVGALVVVVAFVEDDVAFLMEDDVFFDEVVNLREVLFLMSVVLGFGVDVDFLEVLFLDDVVFLDEVVFLVEVIFFVEDDFLTIFCAVTICLDDVLLRGVCFLVEVVFFTTGVEENVCADRVILCDVVLEEVCADSLCREVDFLLIVARRYTYTLAASELLEEAILETGIPDEVPVVETIPGPDKEVEKDRTAEESADDVDERVSEAMVESSEDVELVMYTTVSGPVGIGALSERCCEI